MEEGRRNGKRDQEKKRLQSYTVAQAASNFKKQGCGAGSNQGSFFR